MHHPQNDHHVVLYAKQDQVVAEHPAPNPQMLKTRNQRECKWHIAQIQCRFAQAADEVRRSLPIVPANEIADFDQIALCLP